jgi:hypothetical protein
MTTYSVIWTMDAVYECDRLERSAVDPAAFRKAAAEVDFVLRRLPLDVGESRSGTNRLWYGDLLGIYYRVDEAAHTVRILAVAPARRR